MKGRPVRDGDCRDDIADLGLGDASMKGRPVRDGGLRGAGGRRRQVRASMKGRPVRDGDFFQAENVHQVPASDEGPSR